MKLKVKGFARHRFWGEYSASFVLLFESRDAALTALPELNKRADFGDYYNAGGGRNRSNGWRHLKDGQGDAARALFLDVADPVLAEIVQWFVTHGAEEKKILSMARSIDYGEEFTFEMTVEDPNQQQLL